MGDKWRSEHLIKRSNLHYLGPFSVQNSPVKDKITRPQRAIGNSGNGNRKRKVEKVKSSNECTLE